MTSRVTSESSLHGVIRLDPHTIRSTCSRQYPEATAASAGRSELTTDYCYYSSQSFSRFVTSSAKLGCSRVGCYLLSTMMDPGEAPVS